MQLQHVVVALTLAALATVIEAVKIGDHSSPPPPQKVADSNPVTKRYLPRPVLTTLTTVGAEAKDVEDMLIEPADPCKAGQFVY